MVRLFGFGITILAFAICTPINAKLTLDGDGKVSAENASQDQIANTEMNDLFLADQAIRLDVEKRGGWRAVKDDQAFMQRWEREDSARLKRTGELLELDALKAGIDFYRAAFIFQHGDKPEDYLKAHHLAVIAISKGYDARWISAATLDRYLQSIGKQQIYGTQYRANEAGEYISHPVEPEVVSDAERALLNVPALMRDK
ncbi:MAG: hypothetical protein IPP23_02220 [Sphingomonadales bacterium]|nr:hypothetical protein [Sphingomonadales bacterium]